MIDKTEPNSGTQHQFWEPNSLLGFFTRMLAEIIAFFFVIRQKLILYLWKQEKLHGHLLSHIFTNFISAPPAFCRVTDSQNFWEKSFRISKNSILLRLVSLVFLDLFFHRSILLSFKNFCISLCKKWDSHMDTNLICQRSLISMTWKGYSFLQSFILNLTILWNISTTSVFLTLMVQVLTSWICILLLLI